MGIVMSVIRVLLALILMSGFSLGWSADRLAVENNRQDFGFSSMEIFQFKYDTSYLTIRDMNRDSRDDILFINNKSSRLEVLVRKVEEELTQAMPRLEERVENKGFVLDQWAGSLTVADINMDSRPDIVTVGDQMGLVVHVQEENGGFSEPQSRYIEDVTNLVNVVANDLNNDTFTDILLCRRNNAEILWNNGKGEFRTSLTLTFSEGDCKGGVVGDINGDQIMDLLFYFSSDLHSLRVKPGLGQGGFGWEETLPLPAVRALRIVPPGGDKNAATRLAVIMKNGLVVRLYGFDNQPQPHLLEQVEAVPQRLPLMGIGRKDTLTWAAADFNHDGYGDFFIAAPQLSQVLLYQGNETGLNPLPRAIDSLTAIQKIDVTTGGDLVVFSAAEKSVAIHGQNKLEQFPTLFKIEGKPMAMGLGQPSRVFVVTRDPSRAFRLLCFDAGQPGSAPVQGYDLTLNNAPIDIKVFPLPGDDHWLAILFMSYEAPVVYRLKQGQLVAMQPEQFRAMGQSLTPGAVLAADAAKSGMLLVSEEKIVRLYRWQEDRFVVERQLNPQRKTSHLSAACPFHGPGMTEPGYLLYDDNGQDLAWFPPKSNHSSDKPHSLHFRGGLKDIKGLVPIRVKNKEGLLLVGASEIQWLHEKKSSPTLNILGEYTSPADEPSLWAIFPLELGNPPRPMLSVLDSNNRSLEIIGIDSNHVGLSGQMVFQVFQDP